MEVGKPAALPVRNAALRCRFMSSVMDGLMMISVKKCADKFVFNTLSLTRGCDDSAHFKLTYTITQMAGKYDVTTGEDGLNS